MTNNSSDAENIDMSDGSNSGSGSGSSSEGSNNTSGQVSPTITNLEKIAIEWDYKTKCLLLQAISKYLPVGVNRQFAIINCTRILQQQLPNYIITTDIVEKEIAEYYDLDGFDDSVIDDEEINGFELPSESFRHLIEEKLQTTKKIKT
ncbi:hypothetical protein DFA_05148 [Cavenderia fasciculata]|uniref:Uncharacterized protein n=1 Tax=Cavenderia fasciculata TaxID=261658 RepID=F4PNG5_CACFS|nr:uncharacterized protein DFA_05148 [Cavenderia fasciculata]EGG23018.1 hypothetical protein DFA_05148 [Cavenderia fasciculata]|eukprot:XP_004360869.1 hypothetical protein DFA_05148 [Cavenderia fasciculata]